MARILLAADKAGDAALVSTVVASLTSRDGKFGVYPRKAREQKAKACATKVVTRVALVLSTEQQQAWKSGSGKKDPRQVQLVAGLSQGKYKVVRAPMEDDERAAQGMEDDDTGNIKIDPVKESFRVISFDGSWPWTADSEPAGTSYIKRYEVFYAAAQAAGTGWRTALPHMPPPVLHTDMQGNVLVDDCRDQRHHPGAVHVSFRPPESGSSDQLWSRINVCGDASGNAHAWSPHTEHDEAPSTPVGATQKICGELIDAALLSGDGWWPMHPVTTTERDGHPAAKFSIMRGTHDFGKKWNSLWLEAEGAPSVGGTGGLADPDVLHDASNGRHLFRVTARRLTPAERAGWPKGLTFNEQKDADLREAMAQARFRRRGGGGRWGAIMSQYPSLRTVNISAVLNHWMGVLCPTINRAAITPAERNFIAAASATEGRTRIDIADALNAELSPGKGMSDVGWRRSRAWVENQINNAINHKKTSINNKIQWPDKWLTGHLDARELEQFDAHVRTELPRGFPPTLKDKHLKLLERLKEAEPLTTAFLSEFSGTSVAFAVGLTKVVGATTTRNRQLSVVAAIARITRHTGTQGKRGPGEGGGEEGGGGKRARET